MLSLREEEKRKGFAWPRWESCGRAVCSSVEPRSDATLLAGLINSEGVDVELSGKVWIAAAYCRKIGWLERSGTA